MLSTALIIVGAIVFFVLAWKNFRLALLLLIIFLPTYLLRFRVAGLPSTLLEVMFGIVFLVWSIRYARADWWRIAGIVRQHTLFFVFFGLFMAASAAGVAVSDMVLLSFGQWRAYFLEPALLFFILLGRGVPTLPTKANIGATQPEPDDKRAYVSATDLVFFLLLSTLSISTYALVQWLTGWGIATPEWADPEHRRVTAFFSSPNAIGLFIVPILLIGLALVCQWVRQGLAIVSVRTLLLRIGERDRQAARLLLICGILGLGVVALVFTKSEGAAVALAAGTVVFMWFTGWRKSILIAVLAGLVIVLFVPKIRTAVLFQDKAGQNRLALWGYSWEFLSASPKQFIWGAGVRQFFRKIQKPHYDVKQLERLIYPHNIVLNFWTETGFLGMLGFFGMYIYLAIMAFVWRKGAQVFFWSGFLAALVAILVHGLVDVPYFKNDLAMLWWIIAALFFIASPAAYNHS